MNDAPPFPEFAERTAAALSALGMGRDAVHVAALLRYLQLLQRWNRVYNLTAVRDPAQMLVQHVFDSLAMLPPLRAYRAGRATHVADVGSGAGLPGIILGICEPDWAITCIDAVGKKTAFIRQAAGVLGLANVRVLRGRVESLPGLRADVIVSRAFASLEDFVRVSAHHLVPGGILLAMKGQCPRDEQAALEAATDWCVKRVIALDVPELDAQRHLLELGLKEAHDC